MEQLFDARADRHRETLWWGTYDRVLAQLYAHALTVVRDPNVIRVRMPGEPTISEELMREMHIVAMDAATLAHGALPERLAFERATHAEGRTNE